MNDIDKKIFQNKKKIEENNAELKEKLIQLKEAELKIKENDNEFVLLNKENKSNIIKKLFNIIKVLLIPLVLFTILGILINKYFHIFLIIILFYLLFRFIKETKYERYNLSSESINKFKNSKDYYLGIKKNLDEDIANLLLKIDELNKINSELDIESKKIKEKENESLKDIEKYLYQKNNIDN